MQYGQLWNALADAMNDQFFGMDSHDMRPGSYTTLAKMTLVKMGVPSRAFKGQITGHFKIL